MASLPAGKPSARKRTKQKSGDCRERCRYGEVLGIDERKAKADRVAPHVGADHMAERQIGPRIDQSGHNGEQYEAQWTRPVARIVHRQALKCVANESSRNAGERSR